MNGPYVLLIHRFGTKERRIIDSIRFNGPDAAKEAAIFFGSKGYITKLIYDPVYSRTATAKT